LTPIRVLLLGQVIYTYISVL